MNESLKIALIVLFFLPAVWRIRKGFRNGMMQEIINILSIAVSCVSIALLFLAISSVMARTFSTLTVCMAGLIGIGILFKLCKLIFKPITGIVNISIINGLDKLLGAVMGAGEAVIFAWFLYRVLEYFEVFDMLGG